MRQKSKVYGVAAATVLGTGIFYGFTGVIGGMFIAGCVSYAFNKKIEQKTFNYQTFLDGMVETDMILSVYSLIKKPEKTVSPQ